MNSTRFNFEQHPPPLYNFNSLKCRTEPYMCYIYSSTEFSPIPISTFTTSHPHSLNNLKSTHFSTFIPPHILLHLSSILVPYFNLHQSNFTQISLTLYYKTITKTLNFLLNFYSNLTKKHLLKTT